MRGSLPTLFKPRVTSLAQTCFACPSQWEGRSIDGRRIYIRFRNGWLTVDVDGVGVFGEAAPGDGVMDTNLMVRLTRGVLDWGYFA